MRARGSLHTDPQARLARLAPGSLCPARLRTGRWHRIETLTPASRRAIMGAASLREPPITSGGIPLNRDSIRGDSPLPVSPDTHRGNKCPRALDLFAHAPGLKSKYRWLVVGLGREVTSSGRDVGAGRRPQTLGRERGRAALPEKSGTRLAPDFLGRGVFCWYEPGCWSAEVPKKWG
jgi:hypothetical protein